jgi:hypothetical protein
VQGALGKALAGSSVDAGLVHFLERPLDLLSAAT